MDTPYHTHFPDAAAMAAAVGKEIGLSPWVKITQEHIHAFAQLTGDQQWIHTDPDRAATDSPFGQTVAHGFFVLSLASQIAGQTCRIDGLGLLLNYGLNRVRFTHPVAVNSEIRGRVVLQHLEKVPQGIKFILQLTFELKGIDKPACVAEWIGLGVT